MIEQSGAGILADHTTHSLAVALMEIAANPQRRREMAGRALTFATEVLSPGRFRERVQTITRALHAQAVGTR